MKAFVSALSFYTRVPVPTPADVDPRGLIGFGPVVGALLGTVCAAVLVASQAAVAGPFAPLVGAFLALAASAYLTRGLHLDGLADLADGLGSGLSGEPAVGVMQRSDTGAFGALAIVLVIGLQASLLATLDASAWAAVIVALTCGRLAPVWLCRPGVPAAPGSRLGSWVASSLPTPLALGITAAVAVAGGVLLQASGTTSAGWAAAAVAAGIGTTAWLGRLAVRRFGGITGDVLGAGVEVATTAALLLLAIGA